jgi:hypothetical protein
MSVFCGCCVLSGRGLCDELTARPEESYGLWCVAVCDIETTSVRSHTKQAEPLGDACKEIPLSNLGQKKITF